jgi:amphi-Trp domain-containing protein
MKQNAKFLHESLQDQNSIKNLLKAISSGIGKGKVVLEDDDGVLTLNPEGLLHLKISASEEEDKSKINVRISWDKKKEIPADKTIKIK